MSLEIAIVTSGRFESTRKVVADVQLLKKCKTDIISKIILYCPVGFKKINDIECYEFESHLTFDEKILKIIENCSSEYIWIVNDHSSISSKMIDQLETIEFNEDYVLFCSNHSLVEKLNQVKSEGYKWIPLFGTFINNNIFNRRKILAKYESNLKNYNGTMLNFVISSADFLTKESKISIVYSDAITYGFYKIEEEYKDSWQAGFNSYLNVALWFSKIFDDLYIKTDGIKACEVKKIIRKYNLLTILNLCKLSVIGKIKNDSQINKLLKSRLYKNSWGEFGSFIFKYRVNILIGNLIRLYMWKK